MPTFLHPGVYIQEVPSGARPIEAVGTSTAAFVGFARRGPVNQPLLISRRQDYETLFGGIQPDIATIASGAIGDPLGHAVNAFFLNGGRSAYIVRLANNARTAQGTLDQIGNDVSITINAANPGAWANDLTVRVEGPAVAEQSQDVRIALTIGRQETNRFRVLETFADLSLDPDLADYIEYRVNGVSTLITLALSDQGQAPAQPDQPLSVEITLSGGDDGTPPSLVDYQGIFSQFLKIRDINILCLPGVWWTTPDDSDPSNRAIIGEAIAHCEQAQNRMAIIDLAPGYEISSRNDIVALGLPTQNYCATYYPWATVSNPFYDPETNPGEPRLLLVQPSAFAAGVWAKIDARRGVWKAPAGVETNLLGLVGLQFAIEDAEQDYLNPQGINAFRSLPSFGSVVWGARTLATNADPEWRYIPVRRMALFIEESLRNGIKFAVFEGNDNPLWATLRSAVTAFMDSLFRAGAFQGGSASSAYFVRCGLGDTMTQADIDAGRVIVEVGFAPLKPAEFVILRIQQIAGQ